MRRDPRAFLWDVSEAAKSIQAFTSDLPQIVAFRNQLIHGYALVNTETVWSIVQHALPALRSTVDSLLEELARSAE